MILTLEEVLHTCRNWTQFCELHGYSEWVVNEGGGHVQVIITEQQAHHLGIVKLADYMVKPFEEVYPETKDPEL